MFEPCVLGVDPGVATVGVAAVALQDRKPVLVWADTLRTSPDMADEARLRVIHEGVRAAIAAHHPTSLALERVAWNVNKVSAMAVARATGVILLAASQAGIPVEEYGPLEVKMAITGQGNAEKAQVRDALARFHGLTEVPSQPDAADAVAVALCHLTRSRLRTAERAAGAR